ncbi:MAG TPA: aldo/keto reductase, partial [Planctomycetota bacterium]|nr:aldo/keto reductase [Planctomycetota bacterium]
LAEEILGRQIAGHRHELVITTKAGFKMSDLPNEQWLSRKNILLSCEQSLKRLKTDYVDIFFCHRFDPATPIEESLRALEDLRRQGKILYPAVSNWSAWQTMKGLQVDKELGFARITCLQPMYNLVKRQCEVEILPMAQAEKIGVISYSPLAAGMLTGKFRDKGITAGARLADNPMYVARYSEESYLRDANRFADYADDHGVEPAALAVAWVMSHPAITAPIIGSRNVEQLNGSLKALEIKMTPVWRAEIDALTPVPPPATDRLEEIAGKGTGPYVGGAGAAGSRALQPSTGSPSGSAGRRAAKRK